MFKATIAGWMRPFASAVILTLLLSPVPPASADRGGTAETEGVILKPQGQSNQKVRIHVSGEHCLRVVTAGVRTRNSSSPTASGVITLPAGPTAGSIVWAGLYWTILSDGPTPNAVTLNGGPVTPELLPVSASPCWPEGLTFPYFADVTALAVPGANTVKGLDDSGVLGTSPESEGASLVVIYRSTNSTACEIIVTDGNDLTSVNGQSFDNALPVTCGDNLPATLYFIGGDGQGPAYGYQDNQEWNLAPLGDADDFDGSDPATAGVLPDLAWDTDGWGVVTTPPNMASLAIPAAPTTGFGDCINWVATVLEVAVKQDGNCSPVPTTRATWGQMKDHYR